MKKILFVASSLGVGGMERVLVDISNALVKRNYDVTIITYEKVCGDSYIDDLDSRVHFVYKPHRSFPFLSRIPYIHRYYDSKKKNWETRTSSEKLYRYYVGTKEKYDVEIAFCRGPAVKIISGSTNKSSKKYTWVHNDYTLVDPETITRFFINMETTKRAYQVFNKIIAVSEEARRKFVEVIGYEEKTMTIYNMLDIESIQKKTNMPCPEKKTVFTIISVARIIPAKGYDTLLKAIKRLNDDGLKIELWLVGTRFGGKYDQQLDEYITDNHLANVKLLGRQINPYCYMSQADVYICSSWREGFSISVAEAMCCGLPVISTNCTGPSEILNNGEYGILIDYDENDMYLALKRVLENPELLIEYRRKSLERSKYFSSDRIINEIIKLI